MKPRITPEQAAFAQGKLAILRTATLGCVEQLRAFGLEAAAGEIADTIFPINRACASLLAAVPSVPVPKPKRKKKK